MSSRGGSLFRNSKGFHSEGLFLEWRASPRSNGQQLKCEILLYCDSINVAALAASVAVAACFAVERVAVAECFAVEHVRGSTAEQVHAAE